VNPKLHPGPEFPGPAAKKMPTSPRPPRTNRNERGDEGCETDVYPSVSARWLVGPTLRSQNGRVVVAILRYPIPTPVGTAGSSQRGFPSLGTGPPGPSESILLRHAPDWSAGRTAPPLPAHIPPPSSTPFHAARPPAPQFPWDSMICGRIGATFSDLHNDALKDARPKANSSSSAPP
jgi:hypothetical protein